MHSSTDPRAVKMAESLARVMAGPLDVDVPEVVEEDGQATFKIDTPVGPFVVGVSVREEPAL